MMNQVRLERKPVNEEPELLKLLKKDIVFKVKFYLLFGGAILLFVILCFLSKGPTYGYL